MQKKPSSIPNNCNLVVLEANDVDVAYHHDVRRPQVRTDSISHSLTLTTIFPFLHRRPGPSTVDKFFRAISACVNSKMLMSLTIFSAVRCEEPCFIVLTSRTSGKIQYQPIRPIRLVCMIAYSLSPQEAFLLSSVV
jgi:hypothetical protein